MHSDHSRVLLLSLLTICLALCNSDVHAETVRLNVTRDTWFSAVGDEADCNTGGSSRLKLKSIQEIALVDVDAAPLKGRAIKSATLHLRVAGEERLHRITVSSFASEWVEGTSESYAPERGSSTFNRRRHPDEHWAHAGSDLTAVTLGHGGTVWRMADATPPDGEGWQRIPIDPSVLAARVHGTSHGFLVFDDTGSEWSRNGEALKLRLFPNRFVYSREAGKDRAPYMTVELADGPGGDAPVRPAATVKNLDGAAGAAVASGPLPGRSLEPFKGEGPLPRLGAASVTVVDAFDKLMPATGETVPPQDPAYLAANHLWNAKDRHVRLQAARNEFTSFQVVFRGEVRDVTASLTLAGGGQPLDVKFYRFQDVNSPAGPVPDPLVPLEGAFTTAGAGGSLLCEVYVPHDAPAGERRGALTLASGDAKLELDVSLTVWGFTLPDHLSFIPEMNCYDLPANERDYYRLAHAHRTVLNRVPYYQNGRVAKGFAPGWDGKSLDWRAWDARFGPLLDGSAFADLPRKNVPIECFDLPIHENWPTPIEGNYNGDYWADRAFPPTYRQALVNVSRGMATHFQERAWNDTLFHCFQNGKNNFKERGWSRGSSPWLLDEPANFQDYWALRFFGEAFHEGVNAALPAGAKDAPRMMFRADISRPQWQRDALDHVLDYNVVAGGAFEQYHPLVLRRKRELGQIVVVYGSTNDPAASNMQPVGWCIDAWTRGADGVLPWQTVGSEESWKTADPLSLFYPGGPAGRAEPVPSIRLKAYTRGQQDVEYLALLARVQKQSPLALGGVVRRALKLAGVRKGTGFTGGEDAGLIDFGDLKPQDVWALRVRVGEALSAAKPAPQRRLVEFRTPRRDPAAGRGGYVSTGPIAEAARPQFSDGTSPPAPAEPAPGPPGPVKVAQGSEIVVDTLIDPTQSDQNFGESARDSRLFRNGETSAMLLRIDVPRLGVAKGAKVRRATLSLFVWDPASRGRTRVTAAAVSTPWDEATATWRQPAQGKRWQGAGGAFDAGKDAGPPAGSAVVEPEQGGGDLADPPVEVRIDVTPLLRAWLAGTGENHGLVVMPIADRAVDEGESARFQVFASEHKEVSYTPRLEVELEP